MIGPKTEDLIAKLDDVGITRSEALIWIDEVVAEASALPTHSCSCHIRAAGPCATCKELGCKVWDFNQVALPTLELDDEMLGAFRLESISLDKEPNAFGESIKVCNCPGAPYHASTCPLNKNNA